MGRAPTGWQANYRHPNGGPVCLGVLLAERFYRPEFERKPFYRMKPGDELYKAFRESGVDIEDPATLSLLLSLQQIYDRVPVRDWRGRLQLLASARGFSFQSHL